MMPANKKTYQSGYVYYTVMVVIVITGIYGSTIFFVTQKSLELAQKKINKLQSKVLALSGISLAKAFLAGYDNRGISWEAEEFKSTIEGIGTFILSSEQSGGWLHLKSKGIYIRDTSLVEAVIGQYPPDISNNVLNIIDSEDGIKIADRSSIAGDVAIKGQNIGLVRGGKFLGGIKEFEYCTYNDSSLIRQVEETHKVFKDRSGIRYVPDSLANTSVKDLKKAVKRDADDIFIDGSVSITGDSIDMKEKKVFISGDLIISGNSCVENACLSIRGDTYVSGYAHVNQGTMVALGSVRIMQKAKLRCNIICAESLLVKDNVFIKYPSVLYISPIFENDRYKGRPLLEISGKAQCYGTIISGNFENRGSKPVIKLLGSSHFEGLLFTLNNISLYGTMHGSIYAKSIVYSRPKSEYYGWIMETAIKATDLSNMMVPLVFTQDISPEILCTKEIK